MTEVSQLLLATDSWKLHCGVPEGSVLVLACSLCFVYDLPWTEYKQVTYTFFFIIQALNYVSLWTLLFFQQKKMRKTQVYCVPSWNGIDNSYCNLVPTSTVVTPPRPVSAKHPWTIHNSYVLLLSCWPGHSKPLVGHILHLFFYLLPVKFNIQFQWSLETTIKMFFFVYGLTTHHTKEFVSHILLECKTENSTKVCSEAGKAFMLSSVTEALTEVK